RWLRLPAGLIDRLQGYLPHRRGAESRKLENIEPRDVTPTPPPPPPPPRRAQGQKLLADA
ncbi:hypothetical protein WOC75_21960, partial [Klebsiella pneumoniae]|uniref:hypothetical protein n=1 Tax=Klebsiella pneumoniae TaxID=573 RepID=UPI0030F19481